MAGLGRRAVDRLGRALARRALSSRARVGPRTYFGWPVPRVIAFPGDEDHVVTIGGYCSVAANVEFIIGGNHHTERISTFPFAGAGGPSSKGPITVGNDVWIGKNALILSGITVGDGAAIGANSVVTRDVRPYAIVAGNPAREIRRRFADEEVEALLRIAWWSWPEAEVVSIAPLLTGTDVGAILRYAEGRSRPAGDGGSTPQVSPATRR